MKSRLIIDGNAVYEIDENCREKKRTARTNGKDVFENNRKQPIKRREAQEGEKKRR